MSPLDVIPLPGYPDMYARRVAVEAWQAAGSPRPNSAGRLHAKQKEFWDGWVARLPGFNPADNPDDESQKLAHVRFVAFDIDPTPDRVRRLEAAGFIRPYKHEPWHWELPNVRQYAIVRSIPTTLKGHTDMPLLVNNLSDPNQYYLATWEPMSKDGFPCRLTVRPTLGLEAKTMLAALPPIPRCQMTDAELADFCSQGGYVWDAKKRVGTSWGKPIYQP